ncbi:MAG: hypothetical protein ORN58_04285, partial [Sediminibacterium sp.]|nr:hypothetical protein [Sediminibacterium sp.]
PPFSNPCYYGVDTSTYQELIASKFSIEEIRKYICADSLSYLNEEELMFSLQHFNPHLDVCRACFTGNYPSKI